MKGWQSLDWLPGATVTFRDISLGDSNRQEGGQASVQLWVGDRCPGQGSTGGDAGPGPQTCSVRAAWEADGHTAADGHSSAAGLGSGQTRPSPPLLLLLSPRAW